jgi:hypothetical protein
MHKLGSLFVRGLTALVLSQKRLGSERCKAHGC